MTAYLLIIGIAFLLAMWIMFLCGVTVLLDYLFQKPTISKVHFMNVSEE